MKAEKQTFALFFGNRGFFPASLQRQAREELPAVLSRLGYDTIMMEESATRYGAVETPEEGKKYRSFLEAHRGQFDGVILSLPNFGDETGAVAALKEAGVPIFIQAYPDELDKMAPDKRRDAFCGKFSIMDVFAQYGVDFTIYKPHTAAPGGKAFEENIRQFAGVCRVVNGMKDMTVAAIGARTTAFKTVRIDELALQKHGITMETYDLSDVFRQIKALPASSPALKEKLARLQSYADWQDVPDTDRGGALDNLARLSVVLDTMIREYGFDAIALRCWIEMQQQLGISPCILLSEMNDRGLVGACEVDVGSAVTMRALSLASGNPVTCLDWNNNYAEDPDKCILFHCGPVPAGMMTGKGRVVDHAILKNSVGPGCSYGPNVGRIAPADFTYGNLLTKDGRMEFYIGEAAFTADPVPDDFFGCAGVARFDDLQHVLYTIGKAGHRHHVACSPGKTADILQEAFSTYLGYDILRF